MAVIDAVSLVVTSESTPSSALVGPASWLVNLLPFCCMAAGLYLWWHMLALAAGRDSPALWKYSILIAGVAVATIYLPFGVVLYARAPGLAVRDAAGIAMGVSITAILILAHWEGSRLEPPDGTWEHRGITPPKERDRS